MRNLVELATGSKRTGFINIVLLQNGFLILPLKQIINYRLQTKVNVLMIYV